MGQETYVPNIWINKVYKYQQGGVTSNDPMDQIAQLSTAFLQGDTKSGQQLVEILNNKEIGPQLIKAVQQGIKQQDQRATIIAQAIQTLTQGNTRKARLGAKLNYIRQSIGECPEGEEVIYFKKGGEICKKCSSKKLQKGGKSDPVKDFKKKKEQDAVKKSYELNPYTRGKSAKEIAEMQKRNNQEASRGEGESPADIAPWRKKNNIKKHQQGGEFNKLWQEARDKKNRYFWYKGKAYNTQKKGESKELWAKNFRDNLTYNGNDRVQVDAGLTAGWEGVKGARAGRYNSKGEFTPFRMDAQGKAPLALKGDNVTQYRAFAVADRPSTYIANKNISTLNVIGTNKKKLAEKEKANTIRRNHFNNWTAFVKKYHPNALGSFKKTMENMGYNYDWNTGIYSKSGSAYRLNNGQLQTKNIYTGNWNNISNTDALPGMPAVTMAIRSQK